MNEPGIQAQGTAVFVGRQAGLGPRWLQATAGHHGPGRRSRFQHGALVLLMAALSFTNAGCNPGEILKAVATALNSVASSMGNTSGTSSGTSTNGSTTSPSTPSSGSGSTPATGTVIKPTSSSTSPNRVVLSNNSTGELPRQDTSTVSAKSN
ncbi:MAG: hypothetical protein HY814_06645 [Candidatus Riflebacteria bacterium]|nr:hypothetical protein [Candidatus Riflebacteria bacterium]